MRRRIIPILMFTLLNLSLFVFSLNIQKASGITIIYISADGSIDPPSSPIHRNGPLYTFTDNIYSRIVVERDDIIIDGDGFLLKGIGTGSGFYLRRKSNITICNANIKNFSIGINVEWYSHVATYMNIYGNNITENNVGILLTGSNNSLVDNRITNSINGINVHSSNNTIMRNILIGNLQGISLQGPFNIIIENEIRNSEHGIRIISSVFNTINGNIITENENAIGLYTRADNNIISWNAIADNTFGIRIYSSSSNTISQNSIINNYPGYGIEINKVHEIVSELNIITENLIQNNECGVYLGWSVGNNSLIANNVTNNDRAIWIFGPQARNNSIHHNNIVGNLEQVIISDHCWNLWDQGYPLGGNFWDDYNDIDLNSGPFQNETGSDGIGDTPYFIDSYNQDNFPLMYPWFGHSTVKIPIKSGGNASIESNVAITKALLTKNALHFEASGPSGSIGWINITFPMVNKTNIKVFFNQSKLEPPPWPEITKNATHYFIYFEFSLSTHEIFIKFWWPYDVTEDDYCGIDDIVAIASKFGTAFGHPDWHPVYDINDDNFVGIDDIVSVAEHFGESI